MVYICITHNRSEYNSHTPLGDLRRAAVGDFCTVSGLAAVDLTLDIRFFLPPGVYAEGVAAEAGPTMYRVYLFPQCCNYSATTFQDNVWKTNIQNQCVTGKPNQRLSKIVG